MTTVTMTEATLTDTAQAFEKQLRTVLDGAELQPKLQWSAGPRPDDFYLDITRGEKNVVLYVMTRDNAGSVRVLFNAEQPDNGEAFDRERFMSVNDAAIIIAQGPVSSIECGWDGKQMNTRNATPFDVKLNNTLLNYLKNNLG